MHIFAPFIAIFLFLLVGGLLLYAAINTKKLPILKKLRIVNDDTNIPMFLSLSGLSVVWLILFTIAGQGWFCLFFLIGLRLTAGLLVYIIDKVW